MGRLRYTTLLACLMLCALVLLSRLLYWYGTDPERFPVTTVKVVASYEHITRQEIERVLSKYCHESFLFLPVKSLYVDLMALSWSNKVEIQRIWPSTLKIVLEEKIPVAVWDKFLMTADGKLFSPGVASFDESLPQLRGPEAQKKDVLDMSNTLARILNKVNLRIATLQLRENQAWDLSLANGVQLRLGKRDLSLRLLRFCRAYPTVFAEKVEQLARVDLRYAHGMAVLWKET